MKKVPAPFPADFPEGDLLKYKSYTVSNYVPEPWHFLQAAASFLLFFPYYKYTTFPLIIKAIQPQIPLFLT